ncbi:MAG TPA: MBL fold metallo-hydrolase [Bacteroidia bacterium]|jgi:phosphoribosyl 1,2-cyclic phosphate phosphodiesterase|nr:MBL fold metallo-hydrolase [Bacteroidia bacterium]
MKITFLGTGTSQGVPIIACGCEVCQSTDSHDKRLRSSVMIENEGQLFVIDTGPDFREQMLRENVKRLDAVIYTHEHRDHLGGLDDIRGFNFVMGRAIDLYADENVENAMKKMYPYIFSEIKYPGIPEIVLHRVTGEPFTIGKTKFTPIRVMHYKLPIWGYRIGGFVYITDANFIPAEEKKKIKGCDILVLNALRRESHISHYTLDEAISVATELQPKRAYLTHISHQLGKHKDVEKELPPFIRLAYDRLKLEL